jgi:putative Holliday junction resolvase
MSEPRTQRSPRPGIRVGVDVGTVRVGIAASDPDGVLASPVTTLARDVAGDADIDAIADLAREHGATLVVVGLPRTLRGEEGQAAAAARDYAVRLAARVAPLEVRLVDERLSTVSATRDLRAGGVPGRRQRAVVDQAAAVVVLQAFLDAERGTGVPGGESVVIDAGGPA